VNAAALTWTIIGAGPSSMGVVHGLARKTIATVISKIGSKATTEELSANQTPPDQRPQRPSTTMGHQTTPSSSNWTTDEPSRSPRFK